jgi:hypothetical protein
VWIDDDYLADRVRGLVLKLDADVATPDWWTAELAKANRDAAHSILAKLLGRGYTGAQLHAWAQGPEYQEDVAKYRLLTAASAAFPGGLDVTAYEHLNRLAELDELVLLGVGGDVLEPEAEDAGQVGGGDLKRTDEVFRESVGGVMQFRKW